MQQPPPQSPQNPFGPPPQQPREKTPTWLLVLMWIGISIGILLVGAVLVTLLFFGLVAFACSK
jgi:hypothetical protein